jgi:DNA modification methylase
MEVLKVKISEIKPNPKNPRLIKDEKFKKLVKSIIEFPQMLELRPIVVDENNIILGGNMRFKALKEAGHTEVSIVRANDLTSEQKDEFIVKDNVGFGEWDWDTLANEWDTDKLTDWGLDLPIDLSVQEELEAEEDNYEIPNEINTDIVLGDLFEIGEHRLLCGDSTDSDSVAKLMNGEKADMVFTSPPYNANTKFTNVKNEGKLYENYDDNLTSKEYIEFAESVLEICFLNTEGFIFWNVNYNTNSKNEFIKQIYNRIDFLEELICWKKTALPVPSGLTRTWEPIFVFKTSKELKRIGTLNKTEFNFWDINNSGALDKSHRAAFPIKLVEKSLNLLVNAKIVLEPFCGSGTTMVAAHQLKRKCFGMELDPKYCQVIIDRMKKLDPSLVIKRNGVELK